MSPLYGYTLVHNVHSTLTLMLPPALAWLPGDGQRPVSEGTALNYMENIIELNESFKRFNLQYAKHTKSFISMEHEGTRTGKGKEPLSGEKTVSARPHSAVSLISREH